MKKSIYSCVQVGEKSRLDIELFLDINRELTAEDNINISKHMDKLMDSLNEQSIMLDPESKISAEKERAEIISLFDNNNIYVEEIPNGYCDRYCCKHLPWFIVTTKIGRIKIGWRKRVINIDWSDSIINKKSEELFPNEDVTKFDKTIHAWSLEKAKEYINILLNDSL